MTMTTPAMVWTEHMFCVLKLFTIHPPIHAPAQPPQMVWDDSGTRVGGISVRPFV